MGEESRVMLRAQPVNERRFVAQVTVLVCAHCGAEVKVDNSKPSAVLQVWRLGDTLELTFHCPHCGVEYDISFAFVG